MYHALLCSFHNLADPGHYPLMRKVKLRFVLFAFLSLAYAPSMQNLDGLFAYRYLSLDRLLQA